MYISSMTEKYGDIQNAKKDWETLKDILNRQGSSFLIDAIAKNCGNNSVTFRFSQNDRERLVESLTSELKESLWERL